MISLVEIRLVTGPEVKKVEKMARLQPKHPILMAKIFALTALVSACGSQPASKVESVDQPSNTANGQKTVRVASASGFRADLSFQVVREDLNGAADAPIGAAMPLAARAAPSRGRSAGPMAAAAAVASSGHQDVASGMMVKIARSDLTAADTVHVMLINHIHECRGSSCSDFFENNDFDLTFAGNNAFVGEAHPIAFASEERDRFGVTTRTTRQEIVIFVNGDVQKDAAGRNIGFNLSSAR
jgi:hypothetical protein